MKESVWVEISKSALAHNIAEFRKLIGGDVILCPCVKANAYGHGLAEAASVFVENGADWLAVNAVYEARVLREAGVKVPIYVMGYIGPEELEEAARLEVRMVLYNRETVDQLDELGLKMKVHLKVETGNNRQGIEVDDLVEFAKYAQEKDLEIEGLATHFANIEDTTDHRYAEVQLAKFNSAQKALSSAGINVGIRHCANSAASMLFKKTHFEMVRPGISAYGMWPSNETYLAYFKEIGNGFELKPAFTWKTKIAQVKDVAAGEYIGYGCTYKTTHDGRLAILPVGYYDGYVRGVNGGYVLIHGRRASILGRICMNIMMVDVTDVPEAKIENEVILIGRDGEEEVSAEQFAQWSGTINYEVTTRVNQRILRVMM